MPTAMTDLGARGAACCRVAAVRASPVARPPPAPRRPAGGRGRHRAWPSEPNTRRPRWRCRSRRWPRSRSVRAPAASICAAARSRSRPLLATGGFWYVRNAAVTGNPLYPVAVAVSGLPSPRALRRRRDARRGTTTCPSAISARSARCCSARGIGFARARAQPSPRSGAPVGAASERARAWRNSGRPARRADRFWFAIPYQESRFLFAAFGVAAALMGQRRPGRPPRRLARRSRIALAGALICSGRRSSACS